MTPRLHMATFSSKTAGLWLRCFLERVLAPMAVLVWTIGVAGAQITVEKPLHVSRVQGLVTDWAGKAIAGAQVTLDREDQTFFKTGTDSLGRFVLTDVHGKYWVHVNAVNHATAGREVVIDAPEGGYQSRDTIYVVLGPGSCMDDCSRVFGSKREFDKAVHSASGNHD